MLSKIFIQNFALIDSLEIGLDKGFQAITGETGAGKSIILGALRLVMGERADVKSIQHTDAKSIVEVEFKIADKLKPFFEENDLDFESNTIIRREILTNGKSRAFVNDVPTTLEVLKKLTEKLIDIHSQFETSNIFSEDFQFAIIDGLSDNKIQILDYQKDYAELTRLKSQLQQYKNLLAEGAKEADYHQFLLDELGAADLDNVDLESLEGQLSLLDNAGVISENLGLIFERTDQDELGIIDAFIDIKTKLAKAAEYSHQFTEASARLEELFLEFKDIIFELQNKAEKIEVDPEVHLKLSEKINLIHTLIQKHRVSDVLGLIAIRNQLQNEQNSHEEVEALIEETQSQILAKEALLTKLATVLSKNRKKSIPQFCTQLEGLLKRLGLEKAKVEVELIDSAQFNSFGKENISLLFQANSGFPLRPIHTAISGGERSRVMLAVKKIVAENAELPTLILDEIDTGVSGKVADEIGKLMQEMAQDLQLIAITHLAQVAAKGNDNYKVVKYDVEGKTQSTIVKLSRDEKLKEIAQLLSGSEITDAAIKQAEELMK